MIDTSIYGLKQADIIAYNHIKTNLKPHTYHPVIGTVRLWKHASRPIYFCICVDNFGIKHYDKADVDHLLDKIGKIYNYTTDGDGKQYCDMTLN